MKKTFITHATEKYVQVCLNLVKSIRTFSDTHIIVYLIDTNPDDCQAFYNFNNVEVVFLNLGIDEPENYIVMDNGNFYIDRTNLRSFYVLSAKVTAMKKSLESGWDLVCYLDSDCIATPMVDDLFEWSQNITDFPIGTKGIHEYMMLVKNGNLIGNPFEHTWPSADNTKCLEWPLMEFMGINPNKRGQYRTTGIMLLNKNCLDFVNLWESVCDLLPKITDIVKYAPYHEETIYNVLTWRNNDTGFPLCYINIGDGVNTVLDFYNTEHENNKLVNYDVKNIKTHFYKIPEDKKNVKVLHGEKKKDEVDKIINYLIELNKNEYFK